MPRPALFNDGKTAARHEVAVEIENADLVIADRSGAVITRWALGDIRRVPDTKNGPIRLRCADDPARLTLTDGDDAAWLKRLCPNLEKRAASATRWPTWVAAVIVAVASLAGIFHFLIPGAAGIIVKAVPPGWEQRIGVGSRDQLLQILNRVHDGAAVCRDEAAQATLDRRAQELATLMESPFPITVTVVRFPVANALTLPGGQVVILSGLFDKAESGDAVIGVLAHEIAHAVRRDPLQVSIKQTGAALLVSLLVGDVFGGAVLSGSLSSLIEGGYSRDAEAAADFLAVTALNQLGLTALPLGEFLKRVEDADPAIKMIPPFLNTHPSGENREADIARLSQGMGRAMSGYEWRALKAMCGN